MEVEMAADQGHLEHDAPLFVSFGIVVLDELRFPSLEIMHDVAGGSAIYSKPIP